MPISDKNVESLMTAGKIHGEGSSLSDLDNSEIKGTYNTSENHRLSLELLKRELNEQDFGETIESEKIEDARKLRVEFTALWEKTEELPTIQTLALKEGDILVLKLNDPTVEGQKHRDVLLEVTKPSNPDITRPTMGGSHLKVSLVPGSEPLLEGNENEFTSDYIIKGSTFGGSSISLNRIIAGLYLEVQAGNESFLTSEIQGFAVIRPTEAGFSNFEQISLEKLHENEQPSPDEMETYKTLDEYFSALETRFFSSAYPHERDKYVSKRWTSTNPGSRYKLKYSFYGLDVDGTKNTFAREIDIYDIQNRCLIKINKQSGPLPDTWVYHTQVFYGISDPERTILPSHESAPTLEAVYNYSNSNRLNNTTGISIWDDEHPLRNFNYTVNGSGYLSYGIKYSYLHHSKEAEQAKARIEDNKVIVSSGDTIYFEQPLDFSEDLIQILLAATQENETTME